MIREVIVGSTAIGREVRKTNNLNEVLDEAIDLHFLKGSFGKVFALQSFSQL